MIRIIEPDYDKMNPTPPSNQCRPIIVPCILIECSNGQGSDRSQTRGRISLAIVYWPGSCGRPALSVLGVSGNGVLSELYIYCRMELEFDSAPRGLANVQSRTTNAERLQGVAGELLLLRTWVDVGMARFAVDEICREYGNDMVDLKQFTGRI